MDNKSYFEKQRRYLAENAPSIARTYHNRFIALHDTTIIDSDINREELEHRIYARKRNMNDIENPITIAHSLSLSPGSSNSLTFREDMTPTHLVPIAQSEKRCATHT